tara:strand:- start:937 stop:1626 length:690 start_codon:yes stop_codon:yes gene_type:complete
MTEKRDIQKLVDQESEKFYEFLDPNDVKDFKALTEELRDTWTKKQVFRTETEMRFSVLNDLRYPNNASKYWQCVREQNVYLEQMMKLSFEYRRNESKIKRLKKLLDKETDEYKKEVYEIDLDDRNFSKANMQLVARDRMREIKLWSKLKAEVDDGTFDTQNVNTHQLEAYHKIMINRKDTLSPQSSQPEVFNVLGQLQTIERVQKEKAQLESKKREALSSESTLGAKPE